MTLERTFFYLRWNHVHAPGIRTNGYDLFTCKIMRYFF